VIAKVAIPEEFRDSMRQKMWVYSPPKPKVPDAVKEEVEAKATELVNAFLKPEHTKPPSKNPKWNYLVDLYTKWHRNCFFSVPNMHVLVLMHCRLLLIRGLLDWNTPAVWEERAGLTYLTCVIRAGGGN
jgi:hypothetical protein